MTLLINSNKDFDWVKTPYLFYFRSVKFHYLKETHMMLVAFWWTFWCIPAQKTTKQIFFTTDLFTIWKHRLARPKEQKQ